MSVTCYTLITGQNFRPKHVDKNKTHILCSIRSFWKTFGFRRNDTNHWGKNWSFSTRSDKIHYRGYCTNNSHHSIL